MIKPAPLVERALIATLLASPSVTEIFGQRVMVAPLPQNPLLPALVVQPISDIPVNPTNQGESGVMRARVQLDVWATSYAAAADGAAAVTAVLCPRRPLGGIFMPLHLASAMPGDVTITKCERKNGYPSWEPDERNPNDPAKRLHRRSTDYQVTYSY